MLMRNVVVSLAFGDIATSSLVAQRIGHASGPDVEGRRARLRTLSAMNLAEPAPANSFVRFTAGPKGRVLGMVVGAGMIGGGLALRQDGTSVLARLSPLQVCFP